MHNLALFQLNIAQESLSMMTKTYMKQVLHPTFDIAANHLRKWKILTSYQVK